jgi:hypothetical protein
MEAFVRPLKSTAPATSILSPAFKYQPAATHEPITNPLLEKFRAMQTQTTAPRVVSIRRKK